MVKAQTEEIGEAAFGSEAQARRGFGVRDSGFGEREEKRGGEGATRRHGDAERESGIGNVGNRQSAVGDGEEGGEERLLIEASAVGEAVTAGRVLVAPWGTVESSNGSFVMDEESARMTVEAFSAHGTDLPIDYEHQSLGGQYASPNGQAPAAGWIRRLQVVRPDDRPEAGLTLEPGLYAEVEWTAGARAKLAAREYRYLSPVVIVRKRDRRMVALHSAALTNKPAIVGMRPIVNKEGEAMGKDAGTRELCDVKTWRQENAGTDESELTPHAAVEQLRMRLGLESGDAEAVLIAAERRIEELMEQVGRRDAEDRVAMAVRAGKLVAAQQEWATSLAMRDPAEFDAWAAAAPRVVLLGRTEPPAGSGGAARRAVVVASARSAYRGQPQLAGLTSESAWVAEALREAGILGE